MTSRTCLILVTSAVLISLFGCSSGSSSGSSSGGGIQNPVPSISSLTPPNVNAGGGDFTITVTGKGFASTSTVNWNGSNRMTKEISDTQVTVTITAADIAAVGAAQITVINPPPGGGTSNPVGFVIVGTGAAATPGYVYTLSNQPPDDGFIDAFSIDPSTGSLTLVSGFLVSPYPSLGETGSGPMTTDPSDKFLYVSNNAEGGSGIFAFTIAPSTGALSPVPGSPFTIVSVAGSLSVDFTGKFLYVAGSPSANNISEFGIDATTGALTPISQAACLDSGLTTAVVTDPTAAFLFVANFSGGVPNSSGAICSFTINSLGMLQPVTGSPVSLGANPFNGLPLAVDPSGNFVYAAETNFAGSGPSDVWAFSTTPGAGALNAVPGSPFATGGGRRVPPVARGGPTGPLSVCR
jgi:hypothetical protein